MELRIGADLIFEFFQELDAAQRSQYEALEALYAEWNSKINVISRKDLPNLYERHVLYSLGLAKVWGALPKGTRILDIGTGGGFPAIPLAIFYPHIRITAVDSIGKKILVVKAVANALGLQNIEGLHARVEDIDDTFHLVTGRAITNLLTVRNWIRGKFDKQQATGPLNGLYYLRGMDIEEELQGSSELRTTPLGPLFEGNAFLADRYIHFLPVQMQETTTKKR